VNSSKTSPEFGNNTIEGGYDCYPALFDTVWLRVSFRLLLLLIGDVESIVGVPMLV